MALTVTDNRTAPTNSGADATTGFSSPVAGEAITLFTTAPDPVELTGCLGIAVSTETSEIILTISATDLTDTMLYVWVQANGTMDTLANNGIGLVAGDGTNTIAFQVAGSDKAGFRHEDGPVNWQCLVIDSGNAPSSLDLRGSLVSLDVTNITEIGANFKTLSKALGGASNCFIDQIRYGNGGLTVDGGTTGDRGTFAELALEDRSNTSGKAYGGFRQLSSVLYGCQIALTFGNTGTASHYFEDSNAFISFEDRGQGSGRFGITLQSNTTGVGEFKLGFLQGTENGIQGVFMVQPVNSGCVFDASDPDFDIVALYGCTFINWTGGLDFSDDATNGVNHDVFDTIFDTCGTITPGRVDFKNCKVINSSAAEAMEITDNLNTLMSKWAFTSDGTGHAIALRPTGAGPFTFTLNGHTYADYASVDGSTGNEVILFDPVTSTADVTITITGDGETPTVMKTGTGTVTIVNNKTITFDKLKDNTEVRVYKTSDDSVVGGIENATAGTPDNRNFSWTASAGLSVYYMIHQFVDGGPYYKSIRVEGFIVPNSDTTIDIQQLLARNVS